jgi:hypothetical protein
MEAVSLEPSRRTALRPWLLIFLSAPLLTAAVALLAYRWRAQTQDSARLTEHFIQRQNQVLAHDALRVGKALSDRLGQAARDARLVAALPGDRATLTRYFHSLQTGRTPGSAYPIYNRLAVLTDTGLWTSLHTKKEEATPTFKDCTAMKLCDQTALEAARAIPVGKALVGRGLRWYTPQTETQPERLENGTLSVVYRGPNAVYLLGVSFKSLTEILRLPTFPYQDRTDLLASYENGNYIYLLDRQTNLLAHPKTWHMMGLDPNTGEPMPPMRMDADAGARPLNFGAYQDGRLRPYFDRLFTRSFKGPDVDVFQAANLSGMLRVVSVVAVSLDPKIFEQKNPFGYVGVGCALEHFQEPEERLVPYY